MNDEVIERVWNEIVRKAQMVQFKVGFLNLTFYEIFSRFAPRYLNKTIWE